MVRTRQDKLDYYREYRLRNIETRREYDREYRQQNSEAIREGHLRRKYGIDAQQYEKMLEKQSGACAICAGPPDRNGRLFVDHDWETGAVRGLLCGSCNLGLGKFKDSPSLLEAAKIYLLLGSDKVNVSGNGVVVKNNGPNVEFPFTAMR